MKKNYKKILVIDDDLLTTKLIQEILTTNGYECDICQDIDQLKEIPKPVNYDIFFIDLVLDGITGIDLIKKIRKMAPESIILAVTGLSPSDHLRKVIEAGADDFFSKPLNASIMLHRLKTIIERINSPVIDLSNDIIMKTAFQQASYPIFVTDTDGNLYFANDSFLEFTGFSDHRIRRYNLQTLTLENSQEFRKLLKRCKPEMRETKVIESCFNSGTKSEIWFNIVINPICIKQPRSLSLFLIQFFDVTRKKQMDHFILNNEEKFRSFISLSNDGMAMINEKGQVIEWNSSLTKITGVSMQKVYGEMIWDILSWMKIRIKSYEVSADMLKQFITKSLNYGIQGENAQQNICQISHTDGHNVHIQYSLFTIKMEKGYRMGMVIRDNTATINYQNRIKVQKKELEKAYSEMEKLARIDPLTQIANRRDVEIKLSYELMRLQRHGHPLSIAIADIDNFKKFNDTYGHDMGDFILVEIAKIMIKSARAQDILGRWGGEEFILAFPDTDLKGGHVITERIRQNIANHKFRFKNIEASVSITIGISQFEQNESIESAVKRADNALYFGKENGKNRVVEA